MVTINSNRGSRGFTAAMWNMRRLAQAVIACLVAGAVPAASQGAPDYSGFSSSLCIPFANPQVLPFTDAPMLRFSVEGGAVLTRPMDTGSVGIAMSYDQIPDYQALKSAPGATPGSEFLSSSKMLWVGTRVPATVTFYDGSQEVATASVPVLGVEQAGRCPTYTSGDTCPCTAGSDICPCLDDPGKATCPCPAGGNTCPLPSAKNQGIAYMGVGFGREGNSQPQATPDKNPLLNVTTIAGKPVAPGTFNPGYIIGTTGVTVGLTPANTGGFRFIKLTPSATYPGDWMPASMCVQIDRSDCFPGIVLVDTGISQSYVTVPTPFPTVQAPDPSDPTKEVGVLAPGTTVVVSLPAQSDPVAVDSFTVGQGIRCTPEPLVIPNWPHAGQTSSNGDWTPFVNTGRTFLRKYQLLYDAKNGYVGLKPQQCSGCGG